MSYQNEDFRIRKVPLLSLIDILTELYDSGADFVDIIKEEKEEGQDAMGIIVSQDYYSEKTDLTKEDIKKLLE